MEIKQIQSGVRLGRGEYDWIAGANSPIAKTILVPNLDWKPWKGKHEIQFVNGNEPYDTLFCVTYSALGIIVMILNYCIEKGLIPEEDLQWLKDEGYIGADGKIDFSERFTGTLGETTNQGAYQFKIAQAIKNYGLIPQKDLELADNFKDNIDKKFISEANYAKGEEWKKRFYVNWEWIFDIFDALQYSPVQVIVRFANYSYPEEILTPTGTPNHSVAGVFTATNYDEIRDTYWQEFKRYAKTHTFSMMAFNITFLNKINMNVEKFIKDNDKNQVRNVNTGAYGVIYGGKLLEIKQERAGLYMIDREARGLIGKQTTKQITNSEWEEIKREKDEDNQPKYFANF